MKKIVLLSSKENEGYIHDDHLLEKALTDHGVAFQTKAWEDFVDEGEDLYLIRTTWNYTDDLELFFNKLEKVKDRLWNPIDLVRWNANKKYLCELQAKGVKVMPLRIVASEKSLLKGMEELGGEDFIVKPIVGAGAKGLKRFNKSSPPKIDEEMILQEFYPQISDGEISLIFFDEKFSHAIRKTPVPGEIRVQEEFGGVVTPHPPSKEDLQMAKDAVGRVHGPWLYARVDIVPGVGVIELECVEPSLFFGTSEGASDRLASALLSKLNKAN